MLSTSSLSALYCSKNEVVSLRLPRRLLIKAQISDSTPRSSTNHDLVQIVHVLGTCWVEDAAVLVVEADFSCLFKTAWKMID